MKTWLLWKFVRFMGKRVIGAQTEPDHWVFRISYK